ncbi:MAG: hypothetical protein ACT4QC_14515 [Planctomycetaceae bacterium]
MKRLAVCLSAVGLLIATAFAAEPKLDGVKCVMADKNAAKAEKSLDYKGGKIYFCCDNCPKKFDEKNAKHATKANHQLVATGQTKQGKCPISGQDFKADKEMTINGAKVNFCCDMCIGAVKKKEGDAQLEAVFGDDAFKKADFKVEKAEKK